MTILLVAAMLVPLIVGALLNLWRRGYDNGFRDGSRVAPDIRGIAEIDVLVKRDLLLHQPDPACAVGATRWEHDIMGLCPCH